MKNLFKAIAEFQQEVPTIHKATKGYGYSYADLPTIFEKINPLLKKHGLGFMQPLGSKEGINYIETIIFHIESGEKVSSEVAMPYVQLKGMNDFQSFGSGVTYFRRYALSSALGLVTDVDNDASGEQEKKVAKKASLTAQQFNKAVKAIADGTYTKEELIERFELTSEQTKSLEQ
jgi:hypothetical protein